MRKIATALVGTAAGLSLLAPAAAMATTPDDNAIVPDDSNAAWTHVDSTKASDEKTVENVQGSFAYTQDALTPNERIAAVFNKGVAALCKAATELTVASPSDWTISITGDVENAYSATLAEMQQEEQANVIMGCSCASNGAGGLAAINAEVTGVPLAYIIEKAQPSANANTVVLVSEDGHEISLPLEYVLQRKAVIASQINDEALSESVGGTNQLWVDSTAAKYFARNIVEIRIVENEKAPVDPGTETPDDGEYVNRPNVGITGEHQN